MTAADRVDELEVKREPEVIVRSERGSAGYENYLSKPTKLLSQANNIKYVQWPQSYPDWEPGGGGGGGGDGPQCSIFNIVQPQPAKSHGTR